MKNCQTTCLQMGIWSSFSDSLYFQNQLTNFVNGSVLIGRLDTLIQRIQLLFQMMSPTNSSQSTLFSQQFLLQIRMVPLVKSTSLMLITSLPKSSLTTTPKTMAPLPRNHSGTLLRLLGKKEEPTGLSICKTWGKSSQMTLRSRTLLK